MSETASRYIDGSSHVWCVGGNDDGETGTNVSNVYPAPSQPVVGL